LGNVVVRLRTRPFLEALGAACVPPLEAEAVRLRLLSPEARHHDYERGRLDGPAFHRAVLAATGLTLSYPEWLRLWNDYFEPNRPMEALLARAKAAGLRLWALSNTNAEHLAHLRLNFRVFDSFDGVTASHLVGAAKPEAAIYRQALDGLGLPPAEILYLDDVADYVAAGRAMGLNAFHYTFNDGALREELKRLGVQLPPLDGRSRLSC
jgi:putative hydrolase of the HAD superfamily